MPPCSPPTVTIQQRATIMLDTWPVLLSNSLFKKQQPVHPSKANCSAIWHHVHIAVTSPTWDMDVRQQLTQKHAQ